MATETKDLVDQAQDADDEYRKPNPQDNPRNIALKEIASTVAKKHEVEFAETMPSIDDDGNVTPAPTSAAPPPEPCSNLIAASMLSAITIAPETS